MKNNRKSSKKNEREATFPLCLYASALSVLICCGVSVILLFAFAAVAMCFEDPVSGARICAYLTLYLSSVACGVLSRSFCRGYTLLCGVFSGVFFFLIVLLVSLIYPAKGSTPLGVILHLLLPIFSVLGSFIASFKPQKKKRRKRS